MAGSANHDDDDLTGYAAAWPPCLHRGEQLGFTACACPSGRTAAYECAVFEECTLTRRAIDPAVAFCPLCLDRRPP